MEEVQDANEAENRPRRSTRLALSEINEIVSRESTPNRSTSPDELVIIQRGPRRKPIIWSPVEYDKTRILRPSREKTPEKSPPKKSELNPRLRRRLVLSPSKTVGEDLGNLVVKKLKMIKQINDID